MELACVRPLRHAQVATTTRAIRYRGRSFLLFFVTVSASATRDDRTFRRHCVYHPFFYGRMDGKRRVVCGLRPLGCFRVQYPPAMRVDPSPLLEVYMREGPLWLGPAQLRLYFLCKEVEGNYIPYTTRSSLVCHTRGRLLIVAAHIHRSITGVACIRKTRSPSVPLYTMECWALRLEEA
ncbi:hypothetical protein EDD16DRAFT_1630349 [Pisolithus croceorrhizus]|nr:hypothetical protein EDD16DRAFT_1630349 [Pisolithus croceorrhizus]